MVIPKFRIDDNNKKVVENFSFLSLNIEKYLETKLIILNASYIFRNLNFVCFYAQKI